MKKIFLPHIHYTIKIRDVKDAKGFIKDFLENKVACAHREDNNTSTIYIKHPIKHYEVPTLAHEVIHVLQYIAEQRQIDMVQEQEHIAYMMNYILNEILGYTYK